MKHLYIHIPFCEKKCDYCSFFSLPAAHQHIDSYLDAFSREAVHYALKYAPVLDTVYIGGGTPSLLSASQLSRLAEIIFKIFSMNHPEVTCEINPGTITREKVRILKSAGVNRVSIGIQSLVDDELCAIGRIHSSAQALEAIDLCHKEGISNISIDLITGLPGQTTASMQQTLDKLAQQPVKHVSAYMLHVEEGTPLEGKVSRGEVILPDEDTQIELQDLTADYLSKAGFERYEISNYAKLDYASRHNLGYWNYADFLGIGAGATSMIEGKRIKNVEDIGEYIGEWGSGNGDWGGMQKMEMLSPAIQIGEAIMMGLRKTVGVDLAELSQRFGENVGQRFQKQIGKAISAGLLEQLGTGIRFTPRGVWLSNEVLAEFF